MADLYLTPAERYTAALGGFYYGDLPEPGTVYTHSMSIEYTSAEENKSRSKRISLLKRPLAKNIKV